MEAQINGWVKCLHAEKYETPEQFRKAVENTIKDYFLSGDRAAQMLFNYDSGNVLDTWLNATSRQSEALNMVKTFYWTRKLGTLVKVEFLLRTVSTAKKAW